VISWITWIRRIQVLDSYLISLFCRSEGSHSCVAMRDDQHLSNQFLQRKSTSTQLDGSMDLWLPLTKHLLFISTWSSSWRRTLSLSWTHINFNVVHHLFRVMMYSSRITFSFTWHLDHDNISTCIMDHASASTNKQHTASSIFQPISLADEDVCLFEGGGE